MTTTFGLHIAQGSRNGYGQVVGAAPAVVIAVGEGGALREAKEKSNGRTITIYREQTVFHDAPQNIDHMSVAEARQAADNFWPALKAVYDQNPADYYQVTNETGGDNRKSLANIFAFETRLMELAERDGYKLAVASPAGGSPGSWDLWVELFVPHIRRAGQGGHIYSRHAYGGVSSPSNGGFLTRPGSSTELAERPQPADDNAGRPFREAEYLRSQGINTPMVITEAGQNGGYQFPGTDAFMEDMIRYDQLCMRHDNIWGFCSWTYGNYQNRPANIQDASSSMAQYLQSVGGAVQRTYPVMTPLVPDPPATGWQPPAEPLVSGFGLGDSIERRNGLGQVSFLGGINLRAAASPGAAKLGLAPAGTILRVTGERQNNYLPVQVSAAALRDRPGGEPPVVTGHSRTFVSFHSSLGDFNAVLSGREFSATWTISNSGGNPWTGDFRLAYIQNAVQETANDVSTPMGTRTAHTLRELTGRDIVNPGEMVALPLTLVAPVQPGWYATHWQLQTAGGEAIGTPLWLRLQVQGGVQPPPPRPGRFQPGMNVNPEPEVHPPDVERLRGLHWVRFVYKAAAKGRTVDEAFQQQYRTLIQNYVNAGINCLLILNQETVWGNAPWDNGGWEPYASVLGSAAGQIVRLCAPFGEHVAYQIWNEEDSSVDNRSAIGIAAENFAPLLGETARAIRAANPAATIVIGGLNTGPENALGYLRRLEQRLGGTLPVNALAYHPYGRYVHTDPFYNQQFGRLQDALQAFHQAYPQFPLWITEIGIANDTPIGPEHYQKIAAYMREFVTEVATNHTGRVPVLIWFAWTDGMRNAGINTTMGQLKPHIGDAFREFVALGRPTPAETDLDQESLATAANSVFLRFSTTLDNHNAVPAGSTFTNTWLFRNSGATTWGDGYRLVYTPEGADSASLSAQTTFDLATVAAPAAAAPGDEVSIQLSMTAPEQSGRYYSSRWELRDPDNNPFGHLYAEITVVPTATAGTGVHHADMTFVADHTVADDTRIREGESFLKQWRVRNSGARHWGNGFRLVFVDGDLQMAQGVPAHMVPVAGRDEEVILSVPMIAPAALGGRPATYFSSWRMQDDRGALFGQTVWARIVSLPGGGQTPLGHFNDAAGWFSQLDPRWQAHLLGHGRQNIGDWGCLLTCYAMMIHALGLRLDPGMLNSRLQPLGDDAFRGSVVQFAAPPLLVPGLVRLGNFRSWQADDIPFSTWSGDDPIQRIDQALAGKQFVLAQVDRSPNNAYNTGADQHWVVLLARTPAGDDYLMLDPIIRPERVQEQPLSLMRKYGRVVPSRSHEENLRNAIKSVLIYRYDGGAGG